MLSSSGLALFLFLTSGAVAQRCLCSPTLLRPAGLRVNCSSLGLTEVPPGLPWDTAELHLQDNRLTAVPPGVFDGLPGLKVVSLSGNPFHCGCGIQYLRLWLRRNGAVSGGSPTCATPSSVAHAAVADLADDHFRSCARPDCAGGVYEPLVGVMLCGLIAMLLWSLRLAKNTTFTLDIDERHAGFEADSLRSLKPKHRKRLRGLRSGDSSSDSVSLTWTEDPERTLLNVELLPQVLDVLHKKHQHKD